jgi:hypothetical protein
MSASSKILSGICVLILCFVLLPANIFAQESPAPAQKAITITYDFSKPRVEETSEVPPPKGTLSLTEGYASVTMEGLPQWSEPGLPVLPFKTARVLLPYGFDVERITITCGNKVVLPGSYTVEPGQKAVPLSYEGSVNITPPKPAVYESSAPFPGKLYSGDTIQNKSGHRILLVNLHPVEYIPEQGQLSYYESLTVEITLRAATVAQGECQSIRHLAQDEDMVRELVDNPEIIKSYGTALPGSQKSSLLAPADYQYVIITSETLAATPGPDNFQALIAEKISRGITATIVTTEWVYANYGGTRPDGGEDDQTRIRNFIIDAYNNWGTKYVLLGGDGDGADAGGESGDNIIPARGFSAGGDNDIAADMYYACLDGTFDYNANGIYGEPNDGSGGGEVDLFAEVYVGRAPVDSQAEVQNFVSKTLAYQNIPTTDENLRKVWMVGELLESDGPTWGGDYKDEIREGSSAHGYATVGFEDSSYAPGLQVSTLYDRDYPGHNWPASEIISIINDNAHLINHLGHAGVAYGMKMVNSDVDGLTNSELYFIGYSQGCYSGSFDNRDAYGNYTDYDCIAEHLTTQPRGAVAFIANSRYGFYLPGSTDGPSQHYDREFWDAVFGEDILNIGIANQDSKEDNAGRISNDRWCYYTINLFGDPELTLKLQGGVAYDSHEINDSAGGNGDGYPEPDESINMPVALRNHSNDTGFLNVTATLTATTYATTPIFFEDFEGSWPGDWIVGDDEPTNGEAYWGQSNYRAYRGDFSAYCAGVSDVSGQYYDDYMSSYMVRNVDLSMYDSATLSYKYWLECESGWDHLDVVYSDGSSTYVVKEYTGSTGSWVSDDIEVPATAIQVGFVFYSDYSVTAEGTYIDDVALTGCSFITDPYIDISDASEKYGNIPPDNVATSLDAYDFAIDQACPVGHVVRFNLHIAASNGGPWTGKFDVRIGPPLEDVVRLTTNPDGDHNPSITQTDDGTVWVVWESRRGGSGLWYKTSIDGGETWSDDSPIDLGGMWGYQPGMAQTNDGKIWVTFRSYESGNADIWYTTSIDAGASWSAPSQITTNPDWDGDPAITQTSDGQIWIGWRSHRSGNADIWYKTSADGGENWSDDYQLTTDADWDEQPAITEADDGTVWVVWHSGRSGGNGIWCKTSVDGGETWSGESPVDLGGMWGYHPAIAQTGDGRIWVTFYSYESGNPDIWYTTSSDGGSTWSDASQFTRFVGGDWEPAAAALASGQLALAWMSDRFSNYDIWYGVIDLMEDMNPPPYLHWAENEPCAPDNTQPVTIRASVGDESGIEDVQLVWWVDGQPQSMLQMYDDGAHNDWGAGDGSYGVQIGPFPVVGTVVDYQIQITDIDSNTVLGPQYPYSFEVVEPFVKTADILLVADEDHDEYALYYTEALDNTGYSYDVWETWHRCNIDGDTLNQYLDGIVIWATPDWGYIGRGETLDNLSSYLDNGGKLFISGQDIGYSIGWSSFYQDYLHAQYVQDNIGLYGLFGVPGDPITDGLYVSISGGDGANNQDWPDEIDPISPAQTIFTYDPEATAVLSPLEEPMMAVDKGAPDKNRQQETAGTTITESTGSGAVRVDTGVYRVVYFAFGFEAINSAADRATVMQGVITALNQLAVSTSELPPGAVGEEYEATLRAIGGAEPYTWAIIDGALPDGLGLDADTGVISGTPTTVGTSNFTIQVTDAAEDTVSRELSISVIAFTEFITDPSGDQFSGYGPDIVGADFALDNTTVYFRVRTAEPIDPNDTVDYMLLDLDLNARTGFVYPYPYTNDIGADAVVFVYPPYLQMTMEEGSSLPLQKTGGGQQLETESTQALSTGLMGELYSWDPYYEGFYYAGSFSVFTDTDYFAFAIPLDMLGDDGIMSVVDVIGNSSELTDAAPNEGHGITGEGPDLVIADKWEEWVDEGAGTYTVHCVVKNQGNEAVPAGHEVVLIVDGILLETRPVPVELAPGDEYQDSFDTIVTLSPPADAITVCADSYDFVDELNEENNCLTNAFCIVPTGNIELGLSWLRSNQNPDGSWTYSGRFTEENVGLTSMAITAFLNHAVSESDPAVRKGLDWILSKQDPNSGYISSGVYTVYDTSLAVLALVAAGNSSYYNQIQEAAEFLINLQNNENTGYQTSDAYYGGWPYRQKMYWADLSNTQFVLLALHYAENANTNDILVPQDVWSKAETFVQNCQNLNASNPNWSFYDDGGFIYKPGGTNWAGGQSYASMTMAGLWGFYTTGVSGNDPRVQAAIGWLQNNYYVDRNYPLGSQLLYYYLYGLAKACVLWNIETIDEHDWYQEMTDFLAAQQQPDGYWVGTNPSEEPDNVATCWAILALESKQVPSGTQMNIIVDSPADLLVTDPLGRHEGMNHGTGQEDLEIPGATYSGPGSEPQIVNIPDPIAGTYNITLFGTAAGNYTLSIEGLIGTNVVSTASYSGNIIPAQIYESTATVSSIAGAITIDTTEPETEAVAQIVGETREVNCGILPGVNVTLYQGPIEIGSNVSDGDGNYTLAVPALGNYNVTASKDGFRDKTQAISIDQPTTYTLDFAGNYSLIPNAPDMSYVLACINKWKFGEPPCQLNMSTVLAVINAWKFPI